MRNNQQIDFILKEKEIEKMKSNDIKTLGTLSNRTKQDSRNIGMQSDELV